ncbi:RNA 2',3'-cyclic phosphodiesterase [Paraburkholderia sp. LEh10]|uniref:RNA 2',3'-cyclic phosphodiesterase n=1 Tax=Paraburkholderia sp. LEh10 TaxID=2821353 RepID=UPI001AE37285|nr:RNA 2',3'-cyclic phosphodiesterase [Paraburkholderia sp. LEh10]MBP0594624.1 RNA 2',3'-cyclic phosphodiesterase [Paraburkholderia sp. LEh10]
MQRTDPQPDPEEPESTATPVDIGSANSEAAPHHDYQRCFIALVPDEATRDALSAIPVPTMARRVPYEQLHLTVTFIGVLPYELSAALIDAMTRETVPLNPSPVTKIEHWPRASHPRLTVATLAMSDEFVALDWRVRSSMIALGLPVDARTFRPHVTLARYRHDAAAVGPAADLHTELIARFESLTLYSSTLARNGARYRSLASVPVVYA